MKLLLTLLLTLSSTAFAKNAEITLNTNNSVLYSSEVSLGSATTAMLELADLVIKRGGRNYPIYLVLDSPGGDIYSGENFIQFAKTISNLHTITLNAASMASAIAMALPGNRYVTEHGEYMFHRARVRLGGQISEGEFESRLRSIKKMINKLETRNAKRIGLSLPVYKTLVKDEWWVSAEDAIKYKVADLIVDIKCTPALIKKEISTTINTFFGSVTKKRSACPLIP